MSLLDRFIWIGQLSCAIFLIVGYALFGLFWQIVIGVIIIFGFFTGGLKFNWKWMPSVNLMIACIIAVIGVYIGVQPYWMLFALSAGLASWDLQGYKDRFDPFEHIENRVGVESAHIVFLGLILLSGILISSVSMIIRVQISFGITVIFGAIVIFGLSKFIRHIRKYER